MPQAVTAMTADGVTVLIDSGGPGLPVVAYWGLALPGLDEEQAAALLRMTEGVTGSNAIDVPPRVAIIPRRDHSRAHHRLARASRAARSAAGAGWSPSFQIKTVRAYGEKVSGFVAGGAGLVSAEAADEDGRLTMLIEIELLPTGLLRARAGVTNEREETYALEDLVLSLPLPAEATELLDFAGRHNLERVPQRARLGVGLHLRENRRGRTGAAHPGLEIESCSSGGGRVDLEVLERADRVWVSDNIDPHDRQHMLRWTGQLVPPEYLGSHIASGRSHVTGRRHDLAFRAGTAIFGHLGIEWNLAAATEEELAALAGWVAFFQEHRGLLPAGDVVRMDGYGDDVLVHGVVAPDRSAALIAMVTMASPYPDPPARLRFRGLEPQRRYRLRPLHPADHAPPWWGPGLAGDVLTGAALDHVGVAGPSLRPDQVVLYRAEIIAAA